MAWRVRQAPLELGLQSLAAPAPFYQCTVDSSCSLILEQLCRGERLQPFQTLILSRQPTPSADTEVGPSPDFSVSIGVAVTSRRLSNHSVLQVINILN